MLACGAILAGPANAEDEAPMATDAQAGSDTPVADDFSSVENLDWTVLTRGMEPQPRSVRHARSGGSVSSKPAEWKHTVHPDGSAAVTMKRRLYDNWDAKVGADFSLAKPSTVPTGSVDPMPLLPGNAPGTSAGAAWVSAPAPALDLPLGWDKAAVEARVDPANDRGKVGVSLSKSVTLNPKLALSLQGGISAQESLRGLSDPGAPAALRTQTIERFVRLSVPRTGTTVAVGSTHSTLDDRALRRLSAEQKLFGGVNIAGSINETMTGSYDHSIVARFRRTW